MKQPLADLLRPKTIHDVFGQKHLLKKDGLIARMILKNEAFSIIFYGTPGIGKTSIAMAIANDLKIPYQIFNPVLDSKKVLLDIVDVAKMSDDYIIIVEEVHRLNKDKQDILLPLIEKGIVKIFATTTENPYFVVNPAIRSRCQILELLALSDDDLYDALKANVKKMKFQNPLSDTVLKQISVQVNGDLRAALNILEIIYKLYDDEPMKPDNLKNIMQQSYMVGAHYGDEFHNLKSALQKSVRGSDIDASLHYLARLIKIGDIETIARRMIAMVYEDIGLANVNLCLRVVNGLEAVRVVGFPEAHQILGCLIIEMAASVKSDSGYQAIKKAIRDVEQGKAAIIPKHLWDGHYQSASKLGVQGYRNPHSTKQHYLVQQYMPKALIGHQYYFSGDNNYEEKMKRYLQELKKNENK